MTLRARDLASMRLRGLGLDQARYSTPADVVAALGAVQAQDYAGAKWSVGQRMRSAVDAQLDEALASGEILRTHVLRPTWHFVVPADLAWMLRLTAPRVQALIPGPARKLGITAVHFERANRILERELKGGRQRTREELREALEAQGLPVTGEQRLSYYLMAAEQDGLICSGARQGNHFTYAWLTDRAPWPRAFSREKALEMLAHRFFSTRSPATAQDFSKWSGLTVKDARAGVEALGSRVETLELEGHTHVLWRDAAPVKTRGGTAHRISVFDEYLSSYRMMHGHGEARHVHRLRALATAVIGVVLLDGQVAGTWRRDLRKDTVLVETTLFARATAEQKAALEQATARYGRFVGRVPVTR